jgi:phosphoribosylaminoimidazole-succinocarboxamide synthase
VLTPDSSRFWPADKYEIGKGQSSYDKVGILHLSSILAFHTNSNDFQQYLRDWLTTSGLKGKDGVAMTDEVVAETASKYHEAFSKITGQSGL